jgi:thiol:disulfide interchange protein DsbA
MSEELFTEGVHYKLISPAVPTETGQGQVEVVELFWYGCPHCFDLEPFIQDWLETKSESIDFKRLPATLNPGWITHARTYFALESIGELERIHPLLFMAIHEQGRRLRDIHSITRFLSQQGVDTDKFIEAYESLEVQTKLNQASWLNQQYGASGVPAMVVNGRYLTSASMAGSYYNLFEVVNYLAKNMDAQK